MAMRQKLITLKTKFFRKVGYTKPIYLTDIEVRLIKFCKGDYNDKYELVVHFSQLDTLHHFFEEYYGISPIKYYSYFINRMYNELLNIYFKIKDETQSCGQRIKKIFDPNCNEDINKKHLEEIIIELMHYIKFNKITHNGVCRYNL